MNRLLLGLCVVVSQAPAQPQVQTPPDTEIYLAPLSRERNAIVVGQPINISDSPGYDNQPSFTRDGGSVLFTSARGGTNGETDIHRYDIATRQISRVTQTPEREYSPTVPAPLGDPDVAWTPDGTMLVASAGTLYGWRQGDAGWTPVVALAELGLRNVSRLAVSPAGDRMALVTQK